MSRRTVLRRGGLVATLGATIDACADKIGAGFRVLTGPFLQPGEEPPNVTLVVRLLGRAISSRFQTLLDLDRADFDERANDAAPRSQRDRLADVVHGLLVGFRGIADLAFGEEFSRTLVPITGKTASVPSEVYHQGEHTLARFRDPDTEKPKSKLPGVDPDLSEWAKELEAPVQELGESLGVIEEEKTKASDSVRQKTDMMKDLDFLYSHGYGIVRGLLFLAGLPKTAKELPTLSRTRRSLRGPDAREPGPLGFEPSEPVEPAAPATSSPEADSEDSGSVAEESA